MAIDTKSTKNTLWLQTFFYSFVKEGNIPLYFEEKERLKESQPVINLSIHPIRFADDIFFNFQTNDHKIQAKLKKYEVNYDMFYHYADIIKATVLKTTKKSPFPKSTLLLIGQTEKDKAIFDGERYLSLLDYIDAIKQLAKGYDLVCFKPHPYAKNNNQIYKNLKKNLPNLSITYENIYHLLANDSIKHIAGLNSSVLYEAHYFHKKVTFLYQNSFDFKKDDIGIYGEYFKSSFWADILDLQDTQITIPNSPSRLRKALNDFWGYNEISDAIVQKEILKSKIKSYLAKYLY